MNKNFRTTVFLKGPHLWNVIEKFNALLVEYGLELMGDSHSMDEDSTTAPYEFVIDEITNTDFYGKPYITDKKVTLFELDGEGVEIQKDEILEFIFESVDGKNELTIQTKLDVVYTQFLKNQDDDTERFHKFYNEFLAHLRKINEELCCDNQFVYLWTANLINKISDSIQDTDGMDSVMAEHTAFKDFVGHQIKFEYFNEFDDSIGMLYIYPVSNSIGAIEESIDLLKDNQYYRIPYILEVERIALLLAKTYRNDSSPIFYGKYISDEFPQTGFPVDVDLSKYPADFIERNKDKIIMFGTELINKNYRSANYEQDESPFEIVSVGDNENHLVFWSAESCSEYSELAYSYPALHNKALIQLCANLLYKEPYDYNSNRERSVWEARGDVLCNAITYCEDKVLYIVGHRWHLIEYHAPELQKQIEEYIATLE